MGAFGTAVCGLTWTDEQVREQLGDTSDGGTPMETDAAAADGAAQEDVEQGTSGAWQCHHCGTFDGFCHRPGPGGVGTLCNSTFAGGYSARGKCGGVRNRVVEWLAQVGSERSFCLADVSAGATGYHLSAPLSPIGADGRVQLLLSCLLPLRLSVAWW